MIVRQPCRCHGYTRHVVNNLLNCDCVLLCRTYRGRARSENARYALRVCMLVLVYVCALVRARMCVHMRVCVFHT